MYVHFSWNCLRCHIRCNYLYKAFIQQYSLFNPHIQCVYCVWKLKPFLRILRLKAVDTFFTFRFVYITDACVWALRASSFSRLHFFPSISSKQKKSDNSTLIGTEKAEKSKVRKFIECSSPVQKSGAPESGYTLFPEIFTRVDHSPSHHHDSLSLTWFMNSKSFRWIIDNFPLHYIIPSISVSQMSESRGRWQCYIVSIGDNATR